MKKINVFIVAIMTTLFPASCAKSLHVRKEPANTISQQAYDTLKTLKYHSFTNLTDIPEAVQARKTTQQFLINELSSKETEPSASDVNTEANKTLVERFVKEVINKGNIDLVDELWTEDMQWHSAGFPDTKGREAYKRQLKAAVTGAFTGMHLDIIDIIADRDKVVLYFTNSGQHTGSFGKHKGTGKHAKWYGIGIYRIENGKIAEAWFVEDHYGMYKQLGFIND